MEHNHGKYFGPKRLGVEIEGASLVPVMTDEETAPDTLLKVIRCNCQATSKNICSGKQFLVDLHVLMDLSA